MEMPEEILVIELKSLTPKQKIKTAIHLLELVEIKQAEVGKLYCVKIIQNEKCIFNNPLLLDIPKRIKL